MNRRISLQHTEPRFNFWLAAFPLLLIMVGTARAQSCPNPPVPSVSSPQVPKDVCVPQGFGGNPIQFFDDYSWRAFVAMVWPAKHGERGVPDASKKLGDAGPLVFETLKEDWELFQPDGAAPAPNWNDFGVPSPCSNVTVGFDDLVLASFSKFGNLGQAGFGNLVHALPAQNGTWARYATAFNEVEFNQIVPGKLYLRNNLPAGGLAPFPDGALDVKSAWIDMTNVPHPERYYKRRAWLMMDPVSGKCSEQPMLVGLVGLHIVQKTPSRPQWIWSTFEQIDNVPPTSSVAVPAITCPDAAPPTATPPLTFNKSDGIPMPTSDPNGGFPPNSWSSPVLFNVERKTPTALCTQGTNIQYQQALSTTVWQNYQLVMTQWPTTPNSPATPGTPANTFPGTGAKSAFANTTLETWDQMNITTGCMNCHNLTKKNTDFLWSLQINAFPSTLGTHVFALAKSGKAPKTAAPVSQPLQDLRSLLQRGENANKKSQKPTKTKKPASSQPPQ